MLRNFLNKEATILPVKYRWWLVLAFSLWVIVGFVCAQLVLGALLWAVQMIGVPIAELNRSVLQTLIAACVYVLTLAIVIGVPWIIKRKRTSLAEIGIKGLPTWKDIALAPTGFILYLLATGITVYLLKVLVPSFDASQIQNVGFDNLSQQYEYILAFLTLVVVAPIAEETVFRGYLYGKLRQAVPLWAAMIATSALFGAIHGQWNVAVDVFVLSMVACVLREITGSIWAGILLHMIKNGLAFYLLFINTTFLVQ